MGHKSSRGEAGSSLAAPLRAAGAICFLVIGLIGAIYSVKPANVEGSAAWDQTAAAEGGPYVKRSSSAITMTKDGRLVLAVNPDSNSLSIIDLDKARAVTEIPVGADPRSVAVSDDGSRAYTANRAGNSVSVVDLASRQAVAEIPTGAHPYGVVVSPDGDSLYVAEQGSNRLNILDTATLASRLTLPMPDRPSGLAISGDGRSLYITHLLSNYVTKLAVPSQAVYLPFVMRSFLNDRFMRIGSRRVLPGPTAGFSKISLWPDSNLVQSILIAPNEERAYIPHTLSNSGNPALTLDTTVAPIVSVLDLKTGQQLPGQQLNLDILDPPAVGLPFDAAITPDGAELWVLNAASNDISVIDLETRQWRAHIEVGDNPRGITISPDGNSAYVDNTLSGSVSVIDTATYTVTASITVTSIPLDPVLLTGKRLFYSSDDPRMGKDQWLSCNTCHFDGEQDGRTWLFGFAGPRNTTSLLGMRDTFPLRWSGEWDEAADSEFAIRMDSFGSGLIDGDMNCNLSPPDCVTPPPNAGLSPDLDALAAYLESLSVPLSPGHLHGEPLTPEEQRGQAIFNSPATGCASCHIPPTYSDDLLHDVGTATDNERIGPKFNTPSLLMLYNSAPYFHDGSAPTLYDALTRPTQTGEHNLQGRLSESQIQDLIAFLKALPYTQQAK